MKQYVKNLENCWADRKVEDTIFFFIPQNKPRDLVRVAEALSCLSPTLH